MQHVNDTNHSLVYILLTNHYELPQSESDTHADTCCPVKYALMKENYTVSQKKHPPFYFSKTLSKINRF